MTSTPEDCPICLAPMVKGKAIFTTDCGHTFHFTCLKQSVATGTITCPLCRHLPPQAQAPPAATPANFANTNSFIQQLPQPPPTPAHPVLTGSRPPPPPSANLSSYINRPMPPPTVTSPYGPMGYPPGYPSAYPPGFPPPHGYPGSAVYSPFSGYPPHTGYPPPPSSHPPTGPTGNFADDEPAAVQPPASSTPISATGMTLEVHKEFEDASNIGTNLFTCVHLQAPRIMSEDVSGPRAAADIIAVIDVSGSMGGSKIAIVKDTLKFIVGQLQAYDRLSLVTFQSTSSRLTRLQPMNSTNKPAFNKVIDNIYTSGGTNILSGIQTALNIFQARRTKNPVSSVMLLTDGQDSNSNLLQATKQIFKSVGSNCSIYTFGFGPDHDAKLLNSVAEACHGMFYYIPDISKVGEAFGNCLGGLLSVYAQSIRITITPENGAAIVSVMTNYPTVPAPPGISVTVPDLFSEEARDIPLIAQLPQEPESESPKSFLSVTATYEITSSRSQGTCSTNMLVKLYEPAHLPPQTTNLAVDLQRNRITVARAIQDANKFAMEKNFDRARQVLVSAEEAVSHSATAKDPICVQLLTDIAKSRYGVQSSEAYTSGGQQYLQQQQQSHWAQRATHASPMYQNCVQARSQAISPQMPMPSPHSRH
ncbi:von Willebrand factor [Pelomyxa schiedti]|nr:von Willebrand factor [Pelomyxa schiedti]